MKYAAPAMVTVMAAMLLLPLVAVALLSFSPTYGMDIFATWHPSTRWWRELMTDPSWATAILNSALIGISSAVIALCVVLPAALVWRLEGSPLARNVMLVTGTSLTVPPVVLAAGLYRLIMLIGLYDTAVGLALAHLAYTVPVVMVVLGTRFRATSIEIYSVARSLGASRFPAAVRWVMATQRMTLTGCLTAAVLTSLSVVTVTMYVTDTVVPTIARRALAGVTRDLRPTGFAAMTTWVIVIFLLAFLVTRRLGRVR